MKVEVRGRRQPLVGARKARGEATDEIEKRGREIGVEIAGVDAQAAGLPTARDAFRVDVAPRERVGHADREATARALPPYTLPR